MTPEQSQDVGRVQMATYHRLQTNCMAAVDNLSPQHHRV